MSELNLGENNLELSAVIWADMELFAFIDHVGLSSQ